MAVVNKDSRFPPLYDDPYAEPPVSLACTPPALSELPAAVVNQTTFNQQETSSSADGVIDVPDRRPPGDGASARRDMIPLSVLSSSNDDDDETFHSPCAEEVPNAPISPPPPLLPRNVPDNPSVGNYDEPWDLTSKFRQLEEKFWAVPKLGQAVGTPASPAVVGRPHSQSSEDTRVLADGYDQPWDLLPHRRDARDDVGYDKPWDLKPHEKDVRASVAEDGDYDAPWDIKPRCVIEREVIAAKSAKEEAAARPTPGPRMSVPHASSSTSSSEVTSHSSESGHQKPQYDEPWDQKQKQLVGKVAGTIILWYYTSSVMLSNFIYCCSLTLYTGYNGTIYLPTFNILTHIFHLTSVSHFALGFLVSRAPERTFGYKWHRFFMARMPFYRPTNSNRISVA